MCSLSKHVGIKKLRQQDEKSDIKSWQKILRLHLQPKYLDANYYFNNIELLLKLKSSIENARIIAASGERELQ